MQCSPEQLRFVIYEVCHPNTNLKYGNYGGIEQYYIKGVDAFEAQLGKNPINVIPDYFNDLNACAEFEKLLDTNIESGDSPRYAYASWIYRLTPKESQPFRATAAIRAEAFLRVMRPQLF